uniref:Uncharacterized protein n=1 Tax=Sipha flava TaxID=143950 RepID=A0A2S2QJJ4_9HEMI
MKLQKSILFCLSSGRRDFNSCIRYAFNVKRRRRIRQTVEYGRSRPARRVDFCGLQTKLYRTRSMFSSEVRGRSERFCGHRQLLSWKVWNALSSRSFNSISSSKITLNGYCRIALIET